jgi:hypothetical protein
VIPGNPRTAQAKSISLHTWLVRWFDRGGSWSRSVSQLDDVNDGCLAHTPISVFPDRRNFRCDSRSAISTACVEKQDPECLRHIQCGPSVSFIPCAITRDKIWIGQVSSNIPTNYNGHVGRICVTNARSQGRSPRAREPYKNPNLGRSHRSNSVPTPSALGGAPGTPPQLNEPP